MIRVMLFLSFIACSFPLFSRNDTDSIKGKLTPLRVCFDVTHYDISLKVDPEKRFISGTNTISFKAVNNFSNMQLDFSSEMIVKSVSYRGKKAKYKRTGNTLVVELPEVQQAGTLNSIRVDFSGTPPVAKNPPWQGGFVWTKDSSGNSWVGLACESIGASVWLPCKDHWSDEADSMDMHLQVPAGLTGVSNGKLAGISSKDGFSNFHWAVKNSINNYNISVNIGKYTELRDTFYGIRMVPLSYYVLDKNREKAKKHFEQVSGMLRCNERFFGAYPFAGDSYKLVETPYWGMEHQSCIAYGNNYVNNDFGFDFIIIHESGHEWFANSITAYDPADMWIHESFTTYSEALYVECNSSKENAIRYLETQKVRIANTQPMQGPRDVFFHGRTDSDIYFKGTWMLHTMRSVLNDDERWFLVLKGLSEHFSHRITSTEEVIAYFNKETGRNWDAFFRQYLYSTRIPLLKYEVIDSYGVTIMVYHWENVAEDFDMPVRVYFNENEYTTITPSVEPRTIELGENKHSVRVATELFLVNSQQD